MEVGSRGEICIRKEDMVTHTYIGDHQVGENNHFLILLISGTGGKFATCNNDTRGTGGKHNANTGGAPLLATVISHEFSKNS